MTKVNKHKIKLLKIYEYLAKFSDENNPMSSSEIIQRLEDDGIHCDRKILYDDINTLVENGYDIVSNRSKQMMYYLEDSNFDEYELRILLDAVQSAKFISRAQTEKLSEKISTLSGFSKGLELRSTITCLNLLKTDNKKIPYSVNEILTAIKNKKKISFKYFDLRYDTNINVERVYRKNGGLYKFSPVDLLIENEKYYVVGFTENHETDGASVYRVDKMDSVSVVDEDASKYASESITKLRERTFDMYLGGKTESVTLKFDNSITNEIVDRFGYNIPRDRVDDTHTSVHVKVTVCPTFFAWVFQFGAKLEIMAPERVMQEYRDYLQKALEKINC